MQNNDLEKHKIKSNKNDRPTLLLPTGLSGLLLCICCGFHRVYTRLDLRGDPGIDVGEGHPDVTSDVFAELSKYDIFRFVDRSGLRVLVEASLFLEGIDIGLEHALDGIQNDGRFIRDVLLCLLVVDLARDLLVVLPALLDGALHCPINQYTFDYTLEV